MVLISGDNGTGKTTLCRELLERMDSRLVNIALILNPLLKEEELLKAILENFGLPAKGATSKELLDGINHFLLKSLAAGKTAALIIDEAQRLSTECLEQVRLLSNLETDKEKLIQIILVGSEELPAKLELPRLRLLQQRISLRYHLRPLDKKETRRYLQHRLNMAGEAGGILLAKGACREIYRISRGVPRLINMIAERALLAGYQGQSQKIKRVHVLQGYQSLSGRFPGSQRKVSLWFGHNWQRASIAFIVAIIGAVLLLVPAVQKTLKRYVQRDFTQEYFSSTNYSRQFVRAAIQSPEASLQGRQAWNGKKKVTLAPWVEKEPSVASAPRGTRLKSHSTNHAEEEIAKETLLASAGGVQESGSTSRTENGEKKQRFPQYRLKPPYVYTVQVESFKDEKVAAARMGELQKRGFDAWVVWIDLGEMGIWYRVLVGKYKDKSEAEAMANELGQRQEFQQARQIATHKEGAAGQGVTKSEPPRQ